MAILGQFVLGEATLGENSLFVTPDLGWSNRDELFDPDRNRRLVTFYTTELDTTAEEPSYVKGRHNLIFSCEGTNYIIPGSQIDKFGANGKHYWRFGDGPVQEFILSKVPLPIKRDRKLVQPRII